MESGDSGVEARSAMGGVTGPAGERRAAPKRQVVAARMEAGARDCFFTNEVWRRHEHLGGEKGIGY
jgi:hypothetical protein